MGGLGSVVQIDAQNKAATEAGNAAVSAAYSDYQQLTDRAMQIGQQSSLESMERSRQALRERSKIAVALGEAGFGGNTALRTIANSFIQESWDKGIIETNKENNLTQTKMEIDATHANAQSRVNQANSSMVQPLQGILQIGAGVLGGYQQGLNLNTALNFGKKSPIRKPDLYNKSKELKNPWR